MLIQEVTQARMLVSNTKFSVLCVLMFIIENLFIEVVKDGFFFP